MLLNIKSMPTNASLGSLAHYTWNNHVLVGCETVKTYLLFPVPVLFCRSIWCGRLQNRVQDRGWALLNMFYSNTRSASLVSHSSHSSLCLHPSLYPRLVHLPLPPPLSFVSFAPAVLPPSSSFCDGSTPCSRSHSPASRENGVQLGAWARCWCAGFLPEVLSTWVGLWMLPKTSGRDSRSYLAELVHLLKELVVKNE